MTNVSNNRIIEILSDILTEETKELDESYDESALDNEEFDAEAILNQLIAESDDDIDECDDDNMQEDSDEDDSLDNIDIDDLSPEDLAEIDAELSDIDDDSDDDSDDDDSDDDDSDDDDSDDDDEVSLSPDEEQQADDMMQIAATTMLINDELNDDEKSEFIKKESATAIKEGFMTDADVNMMSEEVGLIEEAKYNGKQIIKLSAESKKKQLYALAVNVSAAAHNDVDYQKLRKLMKMRKIIRAKLETKYHSEASKRMRVYFRRLQSSKSPVVNKLAEKINK